MSTYYQYRNASWLQCYVEVGRYVLTIPHDDTHTPSNHMKDIWCVPLNHTTTLTTKRCRPTTKCVPPFKCHYAHSITYPQKHGSAFLYTQVILEELIQYLHFTHTHLYVLYTTTSIYIIYHMYIVKCDLCSYTVAL